MIFDSHCHLQFKGFDEDRDEVALRCVEKNVGLNIVGTQKDTSKKAVELAEQYEHFYASIGLHPTHLFPTHVVEEETSFVGRGEEFDEAYYDELAASPKVIGVGETGLDLYHLPKDKTKEDVLIKQKEVFLHHAAFAQKHDLPLVIHCRDAHEEMVKTFSELRTPNSEIDGVMHCYTGNWKYATLYLEKGLYLGFTGVITFPPKKTNPKEQLDLLEVIQKCPLDRMLVETDAPFLAPQQYRGKRSEPWMIEEVLSKIAEIKDIPEHEIRERIAQNTTILFNRMITI